MIKQYLSLNSLAKGIVMAGIMFITTSPILANKSNTFSKTSAPEIEVLSTGDTGTFLSVKFDNDNKVNFTVIIKDEAGNSIYRKTFENFSKTFQLVNDNTDNAGKLTLTIAVEGGTSYSYNVNTSFEVSKKIEIVKQ